jgi:hypothetical protein
MPVSKNGGTWRNATPSEASIDGSAASSSAEGSDSSGSSELQRICQELLEVLEKHLLPEDKTAEGQVFYWKMAGDYWRYLAEFATGEDRRAKAEQAKHKYEKASTTAESQGLPPTNPIRLGLALNYSVFYYEILNMPQDACTLAKTAFDDAISELDSLQEEQYKLKMQELEDVAQLLLLQLFS